MVLAIEMFEMNVWTMNIIVNFKIHSSHALGSSGEGLAHDLVVQSWR